MYDNYIYNGKTILQWQLLLKNEYSAGEIYRMAKDGCDLQLLLLRNAGLVTTED